MLRMQAVPWSQTAVLGELHFYHRRSQEACLSSKPRAAFGSKPASHASSLSVRMGSGKVRTCMTLHALGSSSCSRTLQSTSQEVTHQQLCPGENHTWQLKAAIAVGRTQPKTWHRKSHRWGMKKVCPGWQTAAPLPSHQAVFFPQ